MHAMHIRHTSAGHLPAATGVSMKRFQMDRPIMVKRWRVEWQKHGRDFGNCHCGNGMGTMRKHRPLESCPSPCSYCDAVRMMRHMDRKRERYGARRWILEGLAE